ncbi:hypothetical protein T439DRAFT_348399, partial [Meredithblackwellia eburnea MCA 4105]
MPFLALSVSVFRHSLSTMGKNSSKHHSSDDTNSSDYTARLEGAKEERFRHRVLILCAIVSLLDVVVVSVMLNLTDLLPADLQTWGYYTAIVTALNSAWLFSSTSILQKKGTGHHHLYAFVLMLKLGLASTLMADWYALRLTTNRTRIEAICSTAISDTGETDTSTTCAWKWMMMALSMTALLSFVAAQNAALLVFTVKLMLHGRR